MGKSDPPPAPNYAGAAEATGEASKEAVLGQTYANRPKSVTPWGTNEWSTRSQHDPSTGLPVTSWMQEQTLNPTSQRALTNTLNQQADRTGLARDLLNRSKGEFRSDIREPASQWGSLGNYDARRNRAENTAYKSATSRLDPQWQQETSDTEIKLRNQGLQPGDEAYDRQMGNLQRGKTDAYAQARRGAVGEGRAESQLAYGQQMGEAGYANTLRQAQQAEEMQRRGWSLNEINAIMSGQQVASPQMPGFANAAAPQGADMLGAAGLQGQYGMDSYSAQQAGLQGLYSGLGSIAGAGIGKYG